MKRRYLGNLLRAMRYHPAYRKGDDEFYLLQIVDDYRLVFGEKTDSAEALIEQVKAAGIQVWGRHYLDYLRPENALEKQMVDDLIKYARIIRDCVGLSELMLAGYDTKTGNDLLKEVEYVAQGYAESEDES